MNEWRKKVWWIRKESDSNHPHTTQQNAWEETKSGQKYRVIFRVNICWAWNERVSTAKPPNFFPPQPSAVQDTNRGWEALKCFAISSQHRRVVFNIGFSRFHFHLLQQKRKHSDHNHRQHTQQHQQSERDERKVNFFFLRCLSFSSAAANNKTERMKCAERSGKKFAVNLRLDEDSHRTLTAHTSSHMAHEVSSVWLKQVRCMQHSNQRSRLWILMLCSLPRFATHQRTRPTEK